MTKATKVHELPAGVTCEDEWDEGREELRLERIWHPRAVRRLTRRLHLAYEANDPRGITNCDYCGGKVVRALSGRFYMWHLDICMLENMYFYWTDQFHLAHAMYPGIDHCRIGYDDVNNMAFFPSVRGRTPRPRPLGVAKKPARMVRAG